MFSSILKPTAFLNRFSICSLFLVACSWVFLSPAKSQIPKILHFGWDNPTVQKLYDSIGYMQNSPFDGMCISFQEYIMEVFDTTIHPESYYGYSKLRSIKWGRYSDNYLFVRGMSKTGGQWFNDDAWVSITKNMQAVSKALKAGRLKGILFDSEYYYLDSMYNPWTFSKKQYPNRSFQQVQDKVRERGKQFVRALQSSTDDFSILSIWLTSLIADEMKSTSFEKSRFTLLIPFMEGVLLNKGPKIRLIDGNESAYWYSKPSQFLESIESLQKHTTLLMRSAEAKKLVPEILVAQPIFYDGLLATDKVYERGFKNISKWKWLEENFNYAMATSNSNLVWFYSERKNFNSKPNDTLLTILTSAKNNFASPYGKSVSSTRSIANRGDRRNINSETGSYYAGFGQNPMETRGTAFTYDFNVKTKILNLKFTDRIPASIFIFSNNKRIAFIKPEKLLSQVKLDKFHTGRLVILAKYDNGEESCSLRTY